MKFRSYKKSKVAKEFGPRLPKKKLEELTLFMERKKEKQKEENN